jgi:hypothetical protein
MKMSFLRNEVQEGKTSPAWALYHWERGRHRERVKEGKYGGSTMYSCIF